MTNAVKHQIQERKEAPRSQEPFHENVPLPCPPSLALPPTRIRSAVVLDMLRALLFLAVICFPGIAWVFSYDPYSGLKESRMKAPPPEVGWSDLRNVEGLIGKFEIFFKDNFYGRDALIVLNRGILLLLLKTMPSEFVIQGKNGWLFYNQHKNLEEFRNLKPFSRDELKKVAAALQAQSNLAKRNRARFIFYVPPCSPTVYPEELPSWLDIRPNPSRLDQLVEYLGAHTDVVIVDSRNSMQKAKTTFQGLPLYYRTDTHWNGLAAYIGYRDLLTKLQELFPRYRTELQPFELDAFTLRRTPERSGDLTNIIGIPPHWLVDENLELLPNFPRSAKLVLESKPEIQNFLISTSGPDRKSLRLLMFRDSYAIAMIPFLAEHFRWSRYLWGFDRDGEKFTQSRADVIILEMVERRLYSIDPNAFHFPRTWEEKQAFGN